MMVSKFKISSQNIRAKSGYPVMEGSTLFPGLHRKKWPLRGSARLFAYTVSSCQVPSRRPTMTASDPLSLAYADLLTGQYDCVDRIILNAYFPLGCRPGGFRTWWRDLFGNDDHLDNTHLMRWAGRFSRRLRRLGQEKPYSRDRLCRRRAQTRIG